MSEEQSQLKLFSLGIVVETKPKGTDYILVSPVEVLNIQQDGKIKDYKKDFKGNKEDLESTSFQTQHESKNYLRAKWIPFGHSNRITAPDVVVNETVILFKYSQVDEYYWTTIFREPSLRRLETVLYAYSNLRSGISVEEFNKKSSYWLEVSTDNKYVHLKTTMSDGEPYEYDLIVDTKTGFINFRDNKENFIEINSPRDAITLRANKVINLDAPVIRMRSSNGVITADKEGMELEGNRIRDDTTIPGRTRDYNSDIDEDHSRGDLSSRRYRDPLVDNGIYREGRYMESQIWEKTESNTPVMIDNISDYKTNNVTNELTNNANAFTNNITSELTNNSDTVTNNIDTKIENNTPMVYNSKNVKIEENLKVDKTYTKNLYLGPDEYEYTPKGHGSYGSISVTSLTVDGTVVASGADISGDLSVSGDILLKGVPL